VGGHWENRNPGPGYGPDGGIPADKLHDPMWNDAWLAGFTWVFDSDPYLWQLPQNNATNPGYVNPAASNGDPNGWLPIVFGRRRVAAPVFIFREEAYWQWQCIVILGEGEIGSIGRVWCNGFEISNTGAPGFGWAFYPGSPAGDHCAYLDSEATAGKFPPYTSSSPEVGLPNTAYMNIQITQSDASKAWSLLVPGGGTPTFEVEILTGRKVYDHRDGAQSFGSPSTWLPSDNPALALRDLCVNPRWGAAYGIINDTVIDAAADVCDTLTWTGHVSDGLKRFVCNDLILERAALAQHLAQIVIACNGELYNGQDGISLFIDVENIASPVLALDTATNFRDTKFETLSAKDQPTQIVITYKNAAIDFKDDTIRVPETLAGGVELREASYTFAAITDATHATRAGSYILNQNTATPVRATGTVSQVGILLGRGAKVSVTSSDGPAAAPFLVSDAELLADGSYSVTLRQYDASIYLDAVIDHQIPVVTSLGPAFGPDPPDLYVLLDSGTWPSAFKVRWDPRSLKATELFGSAYWTLVTPGSAHTQYPAKVNDGDTAAIAFGFDGAGTNSLTMDTHATSGASRDFVAVRLYWPASVTLTDDIITAATPVVRYSPDNITYMVTTDRVGGVGIHTGIARKLWVAGVWRGVEIQWNDVSAQRYWQLYASAGGADANRVWTEVQFVEADGAVWLDSQIDRYEVHARKAVGAALVTDPTVAIIPSSSRPTTTSYLDLTSATYQTGAVDAFGNLLDFLSALVVTVFLDGRKSAGTPIDRYGFAYAAAAAAGVVPKVDTSIIANPSTGYGAIAVSSADGKLYKNDGTGWTAVGSGGGSSPLTTKGDVYTHDTADQRLAVGADGEVLTADSTKATGLDWKILERTVIEVPSGAIDGDNRVFTLTYTPSQPRVLFFVDDQQLTGGADYWRTGKNVIVRPQSNAPTFAVYVAYLTTDVVPTPIPGTPEAVVAGTGTSWADKSIGSTCYNVAWSPDLKLFAAVAGSSDATHVYTSPDGVTWTAVAVTSASWRGICWGNGRFVATNDGGATTLDSLVSTDGVVWTFYSQNVTPATQGSGWNSICWAQSLGLFCAAQRGNINFHNFATSPDGVTWTVRVSPGQFYNTICWSPRLHLFYAVGDSGGGTFTAATSPDGATWTTGVLPNSSQSYKSAVWVPELALFIVGGYDGIYSSPDATTWTQRSTDALGAYGIGAVCWSPSRQLLIAGGIDNGRTNNVSTSPDGVTWTGRTVPASHGILCIAAGYSPDAVVALGSTAKALLSAS
jgi:hypothetical protein